MKKIELKKWRDDYTPFSGVCLYEGLRLNVHFNEKNWIKHIGGRWHPDPSGGKNGYWWMPKHMLPHILSDETPAYVNIFHQDDDDAMRTSDSGRGGNGLSVFDWLNLNKMISGEGHGDLNPELCHQLFKEMSTARQSEHHVLKSDHGSVHFKFFPSFEEDEDFISEIRDIACIVDTVRVIVRGSSSLVTENSSVPPTRVTNWMTKEQARVLWNALVKTGGAKKMENMNV